MTRLLTAIYENGVFRPLEDPGLDEHQQVTVEILAEPETSPDDALAAWQRVYEGLSDDQIQEIEEIALDRSHFSSREA
ncbi:MAG TPA: antitoxin AF2212-like protein [Thermoanaerobaculia bacterium]|nr:antitoxin AF2212-like protein [Thermoanaerobaculia bacterium]